MIAFTPAPKGIPCPTPVNGRPSLTEVFWNLGKGRPSLTEVFWNSLGQRFGNLSRAAEAFMGALSYRPLPAHSFGENIPANTSLSNPGALPSVE